MKKELTNCVVFLIVLCFFPFNVMAFEKNHIDEQKEFVTEDADANLLCRTNKKLGSPNWPDHLFKARPVEKATARGDNDDLIFHWEKMQFFSNISDAKIELLYADDEGDRDIAWGVKGEEITYTVWIKNNGTSVIDNFVLRMVTTQAVANGEYSWRINEAEPKAEFENQTKNGGPLNAGENTSITFTWTPEYAGKTRLLFEIEYNEDPHPDDNRAFWWFYIMHEHNTVETMEEQNEWNAGNGWSAAQLNEIEDPDPEQHSSPTVWESATIGVQFLEYSMDLSTCRDNEIPFFADPVAGWGTKGVFFVFTFSGSGPASTWEFAAWNTTSQLWDEEWTGAEPINNEWWGYGYGDDESTWWLDGIFLNEHYCTAQFKFRFTGTNLYIDDLWVVSLEGLEIPPPPDPQLSFDIDFKDGEDYSDTNDNGIKDQEFQPGSEYYWNFTINNTAPTGTVEREGQDYPIGATLERVEFNTLKPEGWGVTFIPDPLTEPIGPGEKKEFKMKVNIPADARATSDFQTDNDDWNPHMITFRTTVTPETTDPEASPLIAYWNQTIETIVLNEPSIIVTVDLENQSDDMGAQVEYELNVENSGNCNISVELTAIHPIGSPPVSLDKNSFELQYKEDEDATATVEIPDNMNSGYYTFEISAEATDGDSIITEILNLVVGIEQVFVLALDLKNKMDSNREIDPAEEDSLSHSIEFEIRNLGNGADVAKFVVTAENSDDEDWVDLDDDTVELESAGSLRDENKFTLEFSIPEDAEHGDHNFTVKAVSELDPGSEAETEEKKLTFTILRADLAASTYLGFNPERPVVGESTNIDIRVFNNGTTSASNFYVNLYANDDLVEERLVGNIGKDDFLDLSPFEYIFQDNIEYTLKVVVDPPEGTAEDGDIMEMREDNNEYEMVIIPIAPDLNIDTEEGITIVIDEEQTTLEPDLESLSYKGNKDKGYTVSISVKNTGEAAGKNIKVNLKVYYLDPDGEEVKVYEENKTIKSIEAGEDGSASFTWMPERYGTEYFFEFATDPDDDIPEESDKNNDWGPDDTFITESKPEVNDGLGSVVVISIVIIVILAGIIAVVFILLKRKKK